MLGTVTMRHVNEHFMEFRIELRRSLWYKRGKTFNFTEVSDFIITLLTICSNNHVSDLFEYLNTINVNNQGKTFYIFYLIQ